jgi:hypothetical protein
MKTPSLRCEPFFEKRGIAGFRSSGDGCQRHGVVRTRNRSPSSGVFYRVQPAPSARSNLLQVTATPVKESKINLRLSTPISKHPSFLISSLTRRQRDIFHFAIRVASDHPDGIMHIAASPPNDSSPSVASVCVYLYLIGRSVNLPVSYPLFAHSTIARHFPFRYPSRL